MITLLLRQAICLCMHHFHDLYIDLSYPYILCHLHTYIVVLYITHTHKQVWTCTCLHYTHEHTYTHRGIMYAKTRMHIHTFVNTLVKFGEFMSIKQKAKLNLNQKQNVRNGQIVRSSNQIPFRTK
jgi:hypothetical protein